MSAVDGIIKEIIPTIWAETAKIILTCSAHIRSHIFIRRIRDIRIL